MALVPNIKYKTEYCLYWQQATICEKGAYCFFAHGQQQLRTIEENHKQISLRNSQAGFSQSKLPNYKTVFCKFYAQGQCKLGDQCTYAHERREKRKKKASQEYKIQTTYPHGNLSALPNYDYYNQYCYQQFYHSYMQLHNWYAQQPAGNMHHQWSQSSQQQLFYSEQVEDIKQSGLYNKIITLNNSNEAEQKHQNTPQLQSSGQLSPCTTETASPVHQPLPSLRICCKEIEEQRPQL